MAGTEIGNAFISVGLSTANLAGDVRKVFGEVENSSGAGGRNAGSKGGRSFGAAFAGVAGKVLAVAGPAMVAGLAVKGGISRALNIEDAQAKLTGLGHSTESVTKIMGNAMAAVKGTAFGMGDAASVAAGVVAAGVKPGQDLERTLKLVGDSATIAGTSMGDMGAIFNKVAASNKIQGDVIAQLNDAGIPIVQLLGKELGKTSDEVYDLASKSKIDFATFQNAMEKGLGGAALKSGETFRGSMANLKAALGRVGETVMLPFLAAAKDGANGLIPVIDGVNKKLKPIFGDIGKGYQEMKRSFEDGESPKFASPIITGFAAVGAAAGKAQRVVAGHMSGLKQQMVSSVDAIAGGWQNAGAKIEGGGPTGAMLLIGATARKVFDSLGQAFGPLLPVFQQLGGQIVTLWTSFSPLGLVFQSLAPVLPRIAAMLGQLATALGGALVAALPSITGMFSQLVQILSGAFVQLMPAVMAIVGALGNAFTILGPVIGNVVSAVAPLVTALVSALVPVIVQLVGQVLPPVISIFNSLVSVIAPLVNVLVAALVPAIQGLMPLVTTVFSVIGNVLGSALQIVQGFVDVVVGLFTGDLNKAFGGIGQMFSGAFSLIGNVLSGALDYIGGVFRAIAGVVVGIVSGLGAWLGQFFGGIINWFAPGINALVTWWNGLWAGIGAALTGFWSGLTSWVSGAVASFVQPFVDGFNGLVTFVGGIFQSIGNAISAAWNWIVSLVTDILISFWQVHGTQLTAIWNTVSSIFSAIGNFIAGIWNGIVSAVSGAAQAVWAVVSSVFTTVWGFISGIFNTVTSFIGGVWSGIVGTISAAVNAVRNWIVSGFTTASNTIRSVFSAVAGFLAGIWNNIISGVSGMVGQIGQFFGSIWGKVTGAFAGAGQWLFEAGRNIIQGLLDGAGGLLRNIGSFFLDMVPGWIVGPFKKALGIHSPSRVFRQFGEFIIQGLVVGVKKTGPQATAAITSVAKKVTTEATKHFTKADQLRKAAAGLMKRATEVSGVKAPTLGKDAKANARKMDAYYSAIAKRNKRVADLLAQGRQKIAEANRETAMGKALDATARMISSSNKQIAQLATQRTNLAARLKTAQKSLADATKTRDKAASDAAEKFRDTFDLGDLAGRSAQGIVAAAKKSVASVQGFKGQLDQLRSLGLDSALMAQIGDLGVGKGGAIAKSLIAGGKGLVSQLNGQWKQLGATSQSAGMSLANGMYGAGIAAQQGLVNGLAGNLRAVDAAVKKVTDRMTSQVRKNLGIHSPSRVFRQIGAFTGQGFVLGVGDMESDAKAAMDRLTAVPEAVAAQPSPARSMEPAYSRASAAADRGPTEIHVHETANPRATAIEVARRMEGK